MLQLGKVVLKHRMHSMAHCCVSSPMAHSTLGSCYLDIFLLRLEHPAGPADRTRPHGPWRPPTSAVCSRRRQDCSSATSCNIMEINAYNLTASPRFTSHVIPFSFSSVSMKPQFALTIARILVGPPSFCFYLVYSCKVHFNYWSSEKNTSTKAFRHLAMHYLVLSLRPMDQEIVTGRLQPLPKDIEGPTIRHSEQLQVIWPKSQKRQGAHSNKSLRSG